MATPTTQELTADSEPSPSLWTLTSPHTKAPALNTHTPRQIESGLSPHPPLSSHLQHKEDLQERVIPELELPVAHGPLLQLLLLTVGDLCKRTAFGIFLGQKTSPQPTANPCSLKPLELSAFCHGFAERKKLPSETLLAVMTSLHKSGRTEKLVFASRCHGQAR